MFRKRLYVFVYFWLSWVFIAAGASRAVAIGGCCLVAVLDLLIVVASLVAEHGSRACGHQQVPHVGPALRPPSSGAQARWLWCMGLLEPVSPALILYH